VADYIRHRLDSAGGNQHLFSSRALWLLSVGSGGIPRLINILAHKALISAYGRGLRRVGIAQVAAAIADTSETRLKGKVIAWHCRWPFVVGAAS
jgi:Type II secretory pathway, component ExeA (predicted ATPase)